MAYPSNGMCCVCAAYMHCSREDRQVSSLSAGEVRTISAFSVSRKWAVRLALVCVCVCVCARVRVCVYVCVCVCGGQ